jgi:hypothetical protein
MQTAVHLVASRQTGTATSILRLLLNTAGKEIRLKPDSVRGSVHCAKLFKTNARIFRFHEL